VEQQQLLLSASKVISVLHTIHNGN